MSTRACIAYSSKNTNTQWEGVYSHFDGYPSGLGATIWHILHTHFIGNKGEIGVQNDGRLQTTLQGFVDIYIKGHPSGWSSLANNICYCHDPGFVMRDGLQSGKMDSNRPDPLHIEYVYIINPEQGSITILASESQPDYIEGTIKDEPVKNESGYWDYGHCAYRYRLLATIDLSRSREPDWEAIEKSEQLP